MTYCKTCFFEVFDIGENEFERFLEYDVDEEWEWDMGIVKNVVEYVVWFIYLNGYMILEITKRA